MYPPWVGGLQDGRHDARNYAGASGHDQDPHVAAAEQQIARGANGEAGEDSGARKVEVGGDEFRHGSKHLLINAA
jgi:hypothetical protein